MAEEQLPQSREKKGKADFSIRGQGAEVEITVISTVIQ